MVLEVKRKKKPRMVLEVLKNPFLWRQLLLTAFRPNLLVLLGCILVRNNIPYLFLSTFRDKCTSPAGQVQGKCCSMWLREERLQNKIKSLFPQCLIATGTLRFPLPFPSRAVIDTHTWNSWDLQLLIGFTHGSDNPPEPFVFCPLNDQLFRFIPSHSPAQFLLIILLLFKKSEYACTH